MVKAVAEESGGINPKIPEKTYVVRLAGVSERVLPVPKRDAQNNPVMVNGQPVIEEVPRWEWVFGLRQKEGNDEEDIKFTALTSPKLTTKSNGYSFVKALNGGKAPELHKEFDIDTLVGCYAIAIVKNGKPKQDRTGNVQQPSVIKDLSLCDSEISPEINIEGLMSEGEEDPDDGNTSAQGDAAAAAAKAAADAAAAAQAAAAAVNKAPAKKKK